ncbi:phage antirepressor [Hathewaya histolytica]|uniref:KilA protein, phage-related DNA binding protein n=1 Tax=Hathewaya histolytica TaxID=1498 RepID=A0A4U9RE12_HATHI|nr:phage antirepressor [Hathewaya histolytica]VTQ89909.1 kilA protein, phage-related DNA binding protein [Hathewaya histolytica]
MNNLKVFKNEQFGAVRTLTIENESWFVGKDVAECLGYKDTDQSLRNHVDGEDKLTRKIDGAGQSRNMTIINESGLYSLVLSSKLPSAKKFKRWVTSDVLPSIRKHGMYAKDELLDNPDLLIQVATKLKEEKAKNKMLELQNKQKEQLIGELKPKADYTDRILKNKGLVSTTQIAKDYGMSAQGMNKLLHDLKIQYKQSGQWLLYSRYHSKGYTHSETIDIVRSDGTPDITMNTKWTQKGRLFLYNLLKEREILPIIEQEVEREIYCN